MTKAREDPSGGDLSAIEVFADWLSHREQGRAIDFAEILRRHPKLSSELEDLHSVQVRGVESAHASAIPGSLRARISRRFGEDSLSQVSLHGEGQDSARTDVALARIGELAERGASFGRYGVEGEIARGGMGAILRVWDEDLRRHLAMKVGLDDARADGVVAKSPRRSRAVARFLEEAQVTGQLDHPGIVPVHELGLDDLGRLYFTMKLVRGRDLRAIYDLVFDGQEGWNETRALGVILKACEALAYAHSKGVIHRDLKPSNVMVGNFGEVYVMDWGLARVLGERDARDIRIDLARVPVSSIETDRRAQREATPDSPLVTMEGDVVGTPAYMSPEQARGDVENLSPRSDVYSIGAMLYHLLARRMPYADTEAGAANRTVLARLLEEPPKPLREIREDIPEELAAICEKAMARDPARRYADTLAFAEDLRAFLEHRVVAAYETGAVAELKKWVGRNKPLATALAAGVLVLIAGVLVSTANAREARAATKVAEQNATLAERRADEASRERANVLRLSAFQTLGDLEREADDLWPPYPEMESAMRAWAQRAEELVAGLPKHRATLSEIRARARPRGGEAPPSTATAPDSAYEFDDPGDRWWHTQLSKLVADLEAFTDSGTGGLFSNGCGAAHGWGVPKRIEFAATIADRSIHGPDAARRWAEATAAIASSPKYGGLKLSPQLGLLPIGEDPDSHLWEFSHLATGDPAERGRDGKLVLKETMGLVFVLIPGGTFWMGSQRTDPTGPNYDPQSQDSESPVHEVTLSPYFISKYEMTQGQWMRFTGSNPSGHTSDRHSPDWNREHKGWTALYPVENLPMAPCMLQMSRLRLSMPSEAQWENAARAGTSTVYWSGNEVKSLQGVANVSDAYGHAHGNGTVPVWEPDLDDGYTSSAEVGSFRPNAFGLHDVIGNLYERCIDGFDPAFFAAGPKQDPVSAWKDVKYQVMRGGCWRDNAVNARSASRLTIGPENQSSAIGFRPARSLTDG